GKGPGFVLLQPEELRRGEAGHRDDAGNARETRHRVLQLTALRYRAAVVPDDRRPDHRVSRIEDQRAVHLAREGDGSDAAELDWLSISKRRNHGFGPMPPFLGILLRPARSRLPAGNRSRRFGKNRLALVDEDALRRGGADIEPEEVHRRPWGRG